MTRTWLYVPFEDRDQVQALGAHWDTNSKCWYIEPDQDQSRFLAWLGSDEEGEEPTYSIVSNRVSVATAATECRRCNASIDVVCLYCDEGQIDGELASEFVVSEITSVDSSLERQLKGWPQFRLAYNKTPDIDCFTNHCPHCDAPQEEYLLHHESDGVFFRLHDAEPGVIRYTPLEGTVRLNGNESMAW